MVCSLDHRVLPAVREHHFDWITCNEGIYRLGWWLCSCRGRPATTERGCDGYDCPVPEVGPAATERGCYGVILPILMVAASARTSPTLERILSKMERISMVEYSMFIESKCLMQSHAQRRNMKMFYPKASCDLRTEVWFCPIRTIGN